MDVMRVYITVVIFWGANPVFLWNLDSCTKLTKACPSATQWSDRGKIFNCPGIKRYICLMSTRNELREGCIFNFTIPAGTTGCPCTDLCDLVTDQPILVLPAEYLLCPPETTGCPSRNHSGYSILDIYKYPSCQKSNLSDTSPTDKVSTTNTHLTKDTIRIKQEIIDKMSKLTTEFTVRSGIIIAIMAVLMIIQVILIIIGRRLRYKLKVLEKNPAFYKTKEDVDSNAHQAEENRRQSYSSLNSSS